jgi:hypothetical protein
MVHRDRTAQTTPTAPADTGAPTESLSSRLEGLVRSLRAGRSAADALSTYAGVGIRLADQLWTEIRLSAEHIRLLDAPGYRTGHYGHAHLVTADPTRQPVAEIGVLLLIRRLPPAVTTALFTGTTPLTTLLHTHHPTRHTLRLQTYHNLWTPSGHRIALTAHARTDLRGRPVALTEEAVFADLIDQFPRPRRPAPQLSRPCTPHRS